MRIHLQLRLEGKSQEGLAPRPPSAESGERLREMFWPLGHLQTPQMWQHPRMFHRPAPLQMGRREGALDKTFSSLPVYSVLLPAPPWRPAGCSHSRFVPVRVNLQRKPRAKASLILTPLLPSSQRRCPHSLCPLPVPNPKRPGHLLHFSFPSPDP